MSKNTITVNSAKATITGMIAGAAAFVSGNEADASLEITGNTAIVTNTDVPIINGAYAVLSSAGNTSMTVTGNAVEGTNIKADLVAGAYVEHEEDVNTLTAAVDGNRVTLNQVSPLPEKSSLTVVGGAFLGASGSASTNTVKTTDVKATEIYGGLVQLDGTSGVQNPVGKASGNTVTMNNSKAESVMGGGVRGNNNTGNEANGNTVTLQNRASAGTVIGGKVENGSGNANENRINITENSTVNSVDDMYGGYTDNGSANNNTISIKNGNVTVENSSIFSGRANDGGGDVIGNVVSISGKQSNISAWSVNGGYANNGKAQKNLVDISGEAISADNIVGGDGNTTAESAVQDFVTGNVVNIAGGIITPYSPDNNVVIAGAEFFDPKGVGEIKDNAVNLSGTPDLKRADLYGWKSDDDDYTGKDANGNPLHSGNTLNLGYTATMTDTSGTRTITGSETGWNGTTIHSLYNFDTIYFHDLNPENAGLTVTDTVSLPKNAELEVSDTARKEMNGDAGMKQGDDAVTINGTVLKKPVYLIDASKASEVSGLDDLYNNSKNRIQGSKQWSFENGGVTVDGTLGLKLSGNHILSYGLENIDTITYKTIDWNTNGTVLSLKAPGTSLANTKVDTRDIDFTVNSLAQIVSTGDYSMTLLDTNGNKTLKKENLTTRKGIWNVGNGLTGTGEASLLASGNVIYKMDVTEKTGKPIVEATEETHNALIANEAAMSTLGAGRDRMESVLNGLDQNEPGVFTFASIGGSRDVYDTGSQVKNYNWNGMVGVGNDADLTGGDLAYSVFYEYGKSHYDTDGSGFNGNGDVHYNGGGAMVKFTARNKNYYEGSFRAGRVKNSASDVLHDTAGRACSYETRANYWGGHLGFGHIFDLTDETESQSRGGTQRAARDLDVYGKYFHTHMGSDSFMADEVKYDLDSVDSDLLRIGVRVNNRSGRNNFFYGLAWDYEFDGESKGTVSAAGLSAPIRRADAGGSSAMLELGWKQEATKESPWDLQLTLRGFAGEHRGLGGNVYFGYHF
ncbi:autotransporter outer membrane beta-barrel domain-containing protein [uncultured Dialister sp.]|uniref:autotransporter outer membrane beta-barrel domain-containing protein n=1 Tax=uncultured Dialister sp. TaxID=278064 RepID=UPI0025E372B2|nr:autotransporter outer membrane beta-barrel domain-containing protein [uncultured Dialister sp.]